MKIPPTAVLSGLGSRRFHEVFSVNMTFETNERLMIDMLWIYIVLFISSFHILMLWLWIEFQTAVLKYRNFIWKWRKIVYLLVLLFSGGSINFGRTPSSRSNFLRFYEVFRSIWPNNKLAPFGLVPPPGNPGSTTACCLSFLSYPWNQLLANSKVFLSKLHPNWYKYSYKTLITDG